MAEDSDTIREDNQRLIEAEKQLEQAATLAAKKEQLEREKQELQQKRERTQAQIDALQEEHGSSFVPWPETSMYMLPSPWFAPCMKRKSANGSMPNSLHSLL